MATITEEEKKGMQDAYSKSTGFNQNAFMIDQALNKIQTSFVAKIDKCDGKGSEEGSKRVYATPLIQQTDADFKGMEMPSIPELPYTRYQYGIAAIVIDPVPNDICVFSANRRDITNIKQGTTSPVPAGSFRKFSQSDAVLMGAIHTKKPIVFIELKQDKTILERAPEGIKVETDKDLWEEIKQDRKLDLGRDKLEKIDRHCDTKIKGNNTKAIDGNNEEKIKGNSSLAIDGNNEDTIKGNNTQSIDGNNTITIKGANKITINSDNTITIQGNSNIQVSGNVTIKASQITFDTPKATFTGDVSIQGNNNVSGNIQGSEVKAGSISLSSHTHQGVHGPTGGPM